ncbi:LmbU family transcriptional regulator [Streptomyces sp. NPDC127117]|uniref:LmbU family transcriptional regulator n=1 Tax=Streptomyces sp. NPDC127117 TaxID=3345368 RepID=UPI0036438A1A
MTQPLTRRTSLTLPARMKIDEWKRVGEKLSLFADSSKWWLGDWLVYGQNRYPERYRMAVEETSLEYQTLRNYAWIARKFDAARRRESLSLQHHIEVAGLEEREQDIWLNRAEQNNWSRNELRRSLKATQTIEEPGPERSEAALHLRVSDERIRNWESAAQRTRGDLQEWIIAVLDDAATADVVHPS